MNLLVLWFCKLTPMLTVCRIKRIVHFQHTVKGHVPQKILRSIMEALRDIARPGFLLVGPGAGGFVLKVAMVWGCLRWLLLPNVCSDILRRFYRRPFYSSMISLRQVQIWPISWGPQTAIEACWHALLLRRAWPAYYWWSESAKFIVNKCHDSRWNTSYGQNLVHGKETSLSRVGPYWFCSGGTLDKLSSVYCFRVGPYRFWSDDNPTTLSRLLWSYLDLSGAQKTELEQMTQCCSSVISFNQPSFFLAAILDFHLRKALPKMSTKWL